MRANILGIAGAALMALLMVQCKRDIPTVSYTQEHADRPGRGPKSDTLYVLTKKEGGLEAMGGVKVDIFYTALDFNENRNIIATEFSDNNGVAKFVITGVPRTVWGRGFTISSGDTLTGIMKDASGNIGVLVKDLSAGKNTGIIEMKK